MSSAQDSLASPSAPARGTSETRQRQGMVPMASAAAAAALLLHLLFLSPSAAQPGESHLFQNFRQDSTISLEFLVSFSKLHPARTSNNSLFDLVPHSVSVHCIYLSKQLGLLPPSYPPSHLQVSSAWTVGELKITRMPSGSSGPPTLASSPAARQRSYWSKTTSTSSSSLPFAISQQTTGSTATP